MNDQAQKELCDKYEKRIDRITSIVCAIITSRPDYDQRNSCDDRDRLAEEAAMVLQSIEIECDIWIDKQL